MRSLQFLSVLGLANLTFASHHRSKAEISALAVGELRAFDLDVNMTIDGHPISTSKIIVKEGESETFVRETEGEKNIVSVIAKESTAPDGTKAIKMAFTISKIAADGSTKIISEPQILVRPGLEAMIESGQVGRPKLISMKVVANKVRF